MSFLLTFFDNACPALFGGKKKLGPAGKPATNSFLKLIFIHWKRVVIIKLPLRRPERIHPTHKRHHLPRLYPHPPLPPKPTHQSFP